MSDEYHCTGCRHVYGPVRNDCCSCCHAAKQRREHPARPDDVVADVMDDDPWGPIKDWAWGVVVFLGLCVFVLLTTLPWLLLAAFEALAA